jgi:hypothetical protein
MVTRMTDDGVLIQCLGCSSRTTSAHVLLGPRNVMTAIERSVYRVYSRETKFHEPPFTRATLKNFLIDNYTLPGDNHMWKDGYCDKPISLTDATYAPDANVDIRLAGKHPYKLSIEKPMSRGLRSDGKMAIHDLDNVILTKNCINSLKSNSAASVLPLLKKALQLRRSVEDLPPIQCYYPQVSAAWEVLERVSHLLYFFAYRLLTNIGFRQPAHD